MNAEQQAIAWPAPSLERADHIRLGAQRARVLAVMRDGGWHTLAELEEATGDPQASISARLRDLRSRRCGSWTVERQLVRRGSGQWQYRVRL